MAFGPQLIKYLYGIWYAGLESIVGINKQHTGIREYLCICAESIQLGWEAHYPAVGVSACDRHIVKLACKHVAGRAAAAYYSRPCAVCTCVWALGAAKSELQHRTSVRGVNHAAGLGGYKGLVVDYIEQRSLHQLCLHDRGLYPDEGLIGKHGRTFRYGIYLAGKTHFAQHLQEALVKELQAAKVFYIFRAKVYVLYVIYGGVKARHDGIAAVWHICPEKHIEHSLVFRHAEFVVAVHHGKLVKVRHHGKVSHFFNPPMYFGLYCPSSVLSP